MKLLSQVSKGKIRQPFLGLIYGTDGVGKSSFGAAMPAPLFIGPEAGTANLDVSRLSISSYPELLALLKELLEADHPYQTVVIDSLDWLEPMVWEHLIAKHNATAKGGKAAESIEDFGYGKGFQYAVDEWRKMIPAVNALRERKGMNTLFIAHSHSKDAKDPTVQNDYNRYQLKLNDKAAALFREWVDCVFFANFETMTAIDSKKKVRTIGDGTRYIYTERRPAFDAKNRFGLPFKMPLDWEAVREALDNANPEDPQVLIGIIQSMLEEPAAAKVKDKVLSALERAGTDVQKLRMVENNLSAIINSAPAA
jgi:hypothetical protein